MPPPAAEIARLGLSPFYGKYVSAGGLPVVSSQRVNDYALLEAGYLVLRMLEARPDVLDVLIASRLRVVVIAHDELLGDVPENAHLDRAYWDGRARGLGARRTELAVTAAEENLLALDGDPYAGESILIHELSHAIAEKALIDVDAGFEGRLVTAYEQARGAGLWAGTYASTSHEEYWAELVQSWFDANHSANAHHNHVSTRERLLEYDRAGAALVGEAFGDTAYRYVDPRHRRELLHLAGLDRGALPAFRWRAPVVRLLPARLGANRDGLSSARDGADASVTFENQRAHAVRLFRIDHAGALKDDGWIMPHAEVLRKTKVGRCFMVTDEQRTPLAAFCAEPGTTRALIASYW